MIRKEFAKAVGFLTIVAAAFCGLMWLKWHYGYRASLPQASHRALVQEGGTDILLMGSSLARMGYDPKLIEELTGQGAYVVAYNGMGPTYLHAVLRYLLEEAGIRPRLLLLEGSALTASIPPGLRDKNLFANSPPKLKTEILDLLREDPDGLSFASWYDLVVAAKNQDAIFHPLTALLMKDVFYHGAHMHAPESSLSPQEFAEVEPYPTDLRLLNPRQVKALYDIFELVEKHGIRTAFVGPAVPAPLYARSVIRWKQDNLQTLFENNGFGYVDGTRGFPNDDPANYFDGRHFSARGRRLFSTFLVDKLREQNLLEE